MQEGRRDEGEAPITPHFGGYQSPRRDGLVQPRHLEHAHDGDECGQRPGCPGRVTKGRRWAIFGLLIVVGVMYWIASWIIGFVFGLILGLDGVFWAGQVVRVLLSMFAAVLAAVGYFYLRADGSWIQQLPLGLRGLLRVAGQYAVEPLISNENYSIAGIDGVRGYLEAEDMCVRNRRERGFPALAHRARAAVPGSGYDGWGDEAGDGGDRRREWDATRCNSFVRCAGWERDDCCRRRRPGHYVTKVSCLDNNISKIC